MEMVLAIFNLITKFGPVVKVSTHVVKLILSWVKVREMTEWDKVQRIYAKSNGTFDKKDANIFGLQKANDADDTFNDLICVAVNGQVHRFVGTTDPGRYYAKKPVNPKGTAHIMDGFHRGCWIAGTHRKGKSGMQPNCLVQHGNPVKVWRDTNQNFVYDDGDTVEAGYFGTNFHHAKGAATIGKWSAGCQVIQSKEDFQAFILLVKSSATYKENKKHKFSYMLFRDGVKL